MSPCTRCHGDGFYFTVPPGFNPFRAGGHQTARVAYKVECWCPAARSTGVSDEVPGNISKAARDEPIPEPPPGATP